MITFSITTYFDPFGDAKSERKVFRRRFCHTEMSADEIRQIVAETNETRGYYGEVSLTIKPYKRTTLFIKGQHL